MNTFGNLGGLLCPLVVGWAVERQHSWTLPFHVTAAVYVAGAIAWLVIDPARRIEQDDEKARRTTAEPAELAEHS
jgi:hypothetical protein